MITGKFEITFNFLVKIILMIRDYIQFLGEDHPDVRQFRIAEDNTRHITKDTQHFRDSFNTQFHALLEPNCQLPPSYGKVDPLLRKIK